MNELFERSIAVLELPKVLEKLASFAGSDKKISGKTISFIVPEKLGECVGVKMDLSEFSRMLEMN